MVPLFGKKTAAGGHRTVLIVDIESGSVGSALVRLSEHLPPRLFGETRVALPIPNTLNSQVLLHATEKAAREALLYTATVAARLRTSSIPGARPQKHREIASFGVVDNAVVFLAAPWSDFTPTGRSSPWTHEETLSTNIRRCVAQSFGSISCSFVSLPLATTSAIGSLFQQSNELLYAILSGEILELALAEQGEVRARATIPSGMHTILRTLRSHAGITLPEAHSAFRLRHLSKAEPASLYTEPLEAARKHFLSEFINIASDLLRFSTAEGVVVIAPNPAGKWLAQTLASEPALADLFAKGSSVRALHTHHLTPHITAHAPNPDLLLMLEAIYLDQVAATAGR